MRTFFASLIILAIIVISFGFYRGWFTMSSNRQAENNNVDVSLTVSPDKIKEDAGKVKDKTNELSDRAK